MTPMPSPLGPSRATTVTRRTHFEAAHFLPNVPEEHKCRRMHGHNYEVEITLERSFEAPAAIDDRGFVVDFAEVDTLLGPLLAQVDHQTLNNIPGLENPTAEIIAAWFWDQLSPRLDDYTDLVSVRIYETAVMYATVSRSP